MPGVEILSSTTIYNTILPDWVGAIAIFFIIIFAIIAINVSYDNILLTIFTILTIIFGIFGILSFIKSNDIDYIKYKVIIDDSVSMNEFLDKYEILDQEGKIYTIKERE